MIFTFPMMRHRCMAFIFFVGLLATGCSGFKNAKTDQGPAKNEIVVGFYNVENLFDTINDPAIDDEEYLPGSEKAWNSKKYGDKIRMLSEVIAGFTSGQSSIVGLCEIENEAVVRDLINSPDLRKHDYSVLHIDSPDERGIDVALIYGARKFNLLNSKVFAVPMPEGERPTRDILYAKLRTKKALEIHVFVNHWPSRYGGAKVSEPKRLAAAKVLREAIDSLQSADHLAHIICLGDFNDYPENQSLKSIAKSDDTQTGDLVNLMSGMKKDHRGSYNYRGDWDFLDQIIVSASLVDGKGLHVIDGSAQPYLTPQMIYLDEKQGDEAPFRTYGGNEYLGGYSDHLPVYTRLTFQK